MASRFSFPIFVFLLIPLLEIWLLIRVGGLIGAWPTVFLVLLTGIVGIYLLRREGISTYMRATQKMDAGELPAQEMLEGLVLAVSGALLLTPGFATDLVGFAGLLPWSRKWAIGKLLERGQFVQFSSYQSGHFHQRDTRDEEAIEADFWREDKK